MEKKHLIISDQTYMHDLAYAKRVNEVCAELGTNAYNTFLVFGYNRNSHHDSDGRNSLVDLRVCNAHKLLAYLVSTIKLIIWLRNHCNKYDFYIFENLLSAWPVVFLPRSMKKKCHFDLHGDVPSEIMSLRGSFFLSCIAKFLQKICLNSFSSFSVCSANHRDILVLNHGVKYEKISVIKNSAAFFNDERTMLKKTIRLQHGVYLGSAATWQNPLDIISFAHRWLNIDKNNSFKIITQDIKKFSSLIRLRHRELLLDERLTVFSAYDSELKIALEVCDFGLIIRKRDILNFVSSPTKLFDYQQAGLTILYSGYIGDLSRSSDDSLICIDDRGIQDFHLRFGYED